jgi:hypothetical protein
MYSLFRPKDRTSNISKLAVAESTRFRRGLYRIWMFTWHFQWKQRLGMGPEEADAEIEIHKAFLSVFPTQDLCELERVLAFLKAIMRWIFTARGFDHDGSSSLRNT